MDLSYGPEYESFRSEVRAFLEQHKSQASALAAEIEPTPLRGLLYYLIDSVLARPHVASA